MLPNDEGIVLQKLDFFLIHFMPRVNFSSVLIIGFRKKCFLRHPMLLVLLPVITE